MELKRITTEAEAVNGNQYLVKLRNTAEKVDLWAVGEYINDTLMLPSGLNPKLKRVEFYELPD